ncbi:MAG: phospholipid carrier-dependent glycosyltransferase, partial [Candidatus Sungbacteria bacterium]|nr:phospholipid carrier-dependent glycosyltransferase [Candidatus Sungbacteria bacterium]
MAADDNITTTHFIFPRRHWLPLVLLALGLATRFAFVGWPDAVVFDEVHSGKFVSSYFTGEYAFDVHPPLGKLLTAFALKVAGFRPEFTFANIGEHYANMPYAAFRFFPSFFGALIPLAGYWLARELNFTRLAAFAAGLLLVFDNALLTHSRFAVFDSLMLLLGLTGLAAFLRGRRKTYRLRWLLAAGAAIGLAVATRWTGLAFLAAAIALLGWDTAADFWKRGMSFFQSENHLFIVKALPLLLLIPLVIYILAFAVHFSLLTKPGSGSAFMSSDFPAKNFPAKFFELNRVMYTANTRILTPHQYSSKPYTWPLLLRPVYYWNGGT